MNAPIWIMFGKVGRSVNRIHNPYSRRDTERSELLADDGILGKPFDDPASHKFLNGEICFGNHGMIWLVLDLHFVREESHARALGLWSAQL
jgi:hypothetical protein